MAWAQWVGGLVIVGGSSFFGYQVGVWSSQEALNTCNQARKDDKLARSQMDAKRAQENANLAARYQRERDAAQAAGRAVEQQLADQRREAAKRLKDHDKKLADALAQGDDCVVSPDVIRLLDAAARGS